MNTSMIFTILKVLIYSTPLSIITVLNLLANI